MRLNTMRLELGSGSRPSPHHVTSDARPLPGIDRVIDARDVVSAVGESACDELRATHLLEHFGHRDTDTILRNWHAALKPGGRLYVEVPDMLAQAHALTSGELTPEAVAVLMYGDQDYEENTHRTGFTAASLRRALQRAGFVRVRGGSVGMVVQMEGWRA